MKQDQIEEGRISDHSKGLGTVTREMVEQRAREIAIINGRPADHVSPIDYSQAKRELMGQNFVKPAEDEIPENERWDPVHGSHGEKAIDVAAHDEQSDAEKLVEEGMAEAEHERMLEGTRESLRRGE